jgi:flagellin
MAQVVNTNILSLNAQRNLNSSQGALATSLERLSSGLRINSAKDDAAGLAISERFTTQIRGLNQAVRNANDGISFAQTAEGALSTVGDALQRIRELAVQSANDTNSASDRQALNNEAQQLIAEISRVANATEFNGGRILDGSVRDLFFQVGANQGQNIAVSGVDARTTELGSAVVRGENGLSQDAIKTGIASIGDITISVGGVDVDVSLAGRGDGTGDPTGRYND